MLIFHVGNNSGQLPDAGVPGLHTVSKAHATLKTKKTQLLEQLQLEKLGHCWQNKDFPRTNNPNNKAFASKSKQNPLVCCPLIMNSVVHTEGHTYVFMKPYSE